MEWKFRRGGKTENFKDAGIKEFSKHIFESIVREATQNSLDNAIGDKPVVVKFTFETIDKKRIPNYENLERHLFSCYEYWKDKSNYESLLHKTLERVQSFSGVVPVLRIDDFQTKGMDLSANDDIRKTKYHAFSRGNISIHDHDDSGGSEGQGKAALYAASALRTIFVHTVSSYGSIYEGLAKFSTHFIDGQYYGADGHFGNDPDYPTYETKESAKYPFKRQNEILGTSISILGLWEYKEAQKKMVKSALNNFWLSILDQQLIIFIDDIEINHHNVGDLIDQYLPERNESNRTKNNPTEYGRAKCYYETWTEKFEETEIYPVNLPTLGSCILKIANHDEFPGKIAFFRKQKMLIVRSSVNSFISKGYCGVFVCTDTKGNQILQKMEGKTHTEWNPDFFTENVELGKLAIKEMNDFIKASWEDYRSKHFPETINLKGLPGISNLKGGKNGRSEGDRTKKERTPKPPQPKPEFQKNGIINRSFSSKKIDHKWIYFLNLSSNKDQEVDIELIPASDSSRVSKNELVHITEISEGWIAINNSLNGILKENETTEIIFSLSNEERLGLNFKISTNEI